MPNNFHCSLKNLRNSAFPTYFFCSSFSLSSLSLSRSSSSLVLSLFVFPVKLSQYELRSSLAILQVKRCIRSRVFRRFSKVKPISLRILSAIFKAQPLLRESRKKNKQLKWFLLCNCKHLYHQFIYIFSELKLLSPFKVKSPT